MSEMPYRVNCKCGQPISERNITQRGYYQQEGEKSPRRFLYITYRCPRCKKMGERFLPYETVA